MLFIGRTNQSQSSENDESELTGGENSRRSKYGEFATNETPILKSPVSIITNLYDKQKYNSMAHM